MNFASTKSQFLSHDTPPFTMKVSTFLAVSLVLVICLESACAFTFPRESSTSTSDNNNKKRTVLQQIFFPTVIFTSSTTTTTKAPAIKAPTTESLLSSTLSILQQQLQTTINSTASSNVTSENGNTTLVFQNSTDTDTQNSTIVESSPTNSNTTVNGTAACQPQIGQKKPSYLSDTFIRSKLCSNINSTLLRDYRFDLNAKVCSLVGKQSHCGKNMIFYGYAENAVYGHCDCDYSSQNPLLYDEKTSRCYFMYQRGYCKDGDWLEFSRNGTLECTRNKCYNAGRLQFGAPPLADRDMAPEYVPLRGDGPCVQLNQPNQKFCTGSNNTVAFRWPRTVYPTCGPAIKPTPPPFPEIPSRVSGRFLGDVYSLECKPGSYLNVVGTCEPNWDFD